MTIGMKTIVVPGIEFKIPVLGFGCSSLTGTSRKNAIRSLHTAFDSGVRHYDVARSYGYGETERILGGFAKFRRSQITITSKFGLQPPARTNPTQLAIHLGRRFVRLVPATRKLLQPRTKFLVTTPAFGAGECKQSLELSLRELGTDYIDFYLLHDYAVTDHLPDDLLKFLEGAVRQGKIRYFGLGTSIDNVLRACEVQPELCKIIQFQNSVLTRNAEKLPATSFTSLTITHGSLSASYCSLSSFLKENADIAKYWSAELDLDCSNHDALAALLLNYAVEANSNGIVLFSSRNPARVAANVNSVLRPRLSSAQVALFVRLVEHASVPLLS